MYVMSLYTVLGYRFCSVPYTPEQITGVHGSLSGRSENTFDDLGVYYGH